MNDEAVVHLRSSEDNEVTECGWPIIPAMTVTDVRARATCPDCLDAVVHPEPAEEPESLRCPTCDQFIARKMRAPSADDLGAAIHASKYRDHASHNDGACHCWDLARDVSTAAPFVHPEPGDRAEGCVICGKPIRPEDSGLCDAHKYDEQLRAEKWWAGLFLFPNPDSTRQKDFVKVAIALADAEVAAAVAAVRADRDALGAQVAAVKAALEQLEMCHIGGWDFEHAVRAALEEKP